MDLSVVLAIGGALASDGVLPPVLDVGSVLDPGGRQGGGREVSGSLLGDGSWAKVLWLAERLLLSIGELKPWQEYGSACH